MGGTVGRRQEIRARMENGRVEFPVRFKVDAMASSSFTLISDTSQSSVTYRPVGLLA